MIVDTKKTKREKRVFADAHQVAHVWAQQRQTDGRNPSKNIYFEGATIYSYGSHFALARFAGPGVVLVNDNSYSVTTAKHQSCVRDALRGLPVTSISVDDPTERASATRNLALLWAEIEKLAKQHRDARERDCRDLLRSKIANYASYAKFAKQGRTQALAALVIASGSDPQFWAELAHCSKLAATQIDQEKAERATLRDARTSAKRERENAKRVRGAELAAILRPLVETAWRNGSERCGIPADIATTFADCLSAAEIATGVRVDGFIYNGWQQPTLLRIVGDEIQTSRGARVTVRAAVRAWPHLLARNVPPQPVGQFEATSFADGVLTIGCHKIGVDEMNRLASQLGLEGQIVA